MSKGATTEVAIVDYGMGNLFSVSQACEQAGWSWSITSSSQDLLLSDAVILPGVGAFGDAMETLSKLAERCRDMLKQMDICEKWNERHMRVEI